ncbi:hypothetical protein DCS_03586 [Drechmeria coniospora]|uniref:Uncharacterized protein n=1 Tax=Drechmeria coniospora TaxID=98403 RepID=A0A151GHJ0_DRECN|nr:hypothetical protein DCS_03586 [Drechmeria coniospora]KYK56585.1 hypothetical protein DCS_03586 [Drechmeria coniospora]
MPLQRTFTVIQPVGEPADGFRPPPRPMTSKQVREAYKASNRGPPLSRAERIRQEKAEQERIRKDLDRERSTARARLLRERKRDKELEVKALKRKDRLPLVTVRPSQDTIARFVRGNGAGRKRVADGHPIEPSDKVQPVRKQPKLWELMDGSDLIPDDDGLDLDSLENPEMRAATERDLTAKADGLDRSILGQSTKPAVLPETTVLPESEPRSQAGLATAGEADLELHIGTSVKPEQGPPLVKQNDAHSPRDTLSSPPRQEPPLSTQAILVNYDNFFPSFSQQERELLEEGMEDAPSRLPKPRLRRTLAANDRRTDTLRERSAVHPPTSIATLSDSDVIGSPALRGRQNATLGAIRQQPLPQQRCTTAGQLKEPWPMMQAPGPKVTWHPEIKVARVTKQPPPPLPAEAKGLQPLEADKENVPGPHAGSPPDDLLSASQETEYGGGWVDEMALELAI